MRSSMPIFNGNVREDDMMPLRRILSFVCPVTCVACLAVGYASNRQGIALVIALLILPVWLLARKRPSSMPPSVALVISVSIATVGLFAGVSSFLMILSATLALASWDLVLLDQTLTGSSVSSAKAITLFENRRYQSLALALGPGLLIAVTGQMIHLQIPFIGLVLLVILALFSLDRVWRALRD
jgi:hypothetical protein